MDFANLFVTLGEGTFATVADAKEAGVATLNYGVFLNTVIEFLIVAFAIFMVVKQVNRLKRPGPGGRADDEGLPALRDGHPGRREEVPELHVAALGAGARGFEELQGTRDAG